MAQRMTFHVEITTRDDQLVEGRENLEKMQQAIRDAVASVPGVESTSLEAGNLYQSPLVNYYTHSAIRPRYRAKVTARATGGNEASVSRHAKRQMERLDWCGQGYAFGNRRVESTRLIERPVVSDEPVALVVTDEEPIAVANAAD